jgi:hypothetical protein
MGLDMYLNVKCYLDTDELSAVRDVLKENDIQGLNNYTPKTIEFEIGYWRKANQIHNWFVENVQLGKDDCNEYYVDKSQLLALKETCEKVLNDTSLAAELLPPRKGFFFGSSDIDEYYLNDLTKTVSILNKMFNNPQHKKWSVYYESSW